MMRRRLDLLPRHHVTAAAVVILAAAACSFSTGGVEGKYYFHDAAAAGAGASSSPWGSYYDHGAEVRPLAAATAVVEDEVAPEFPVGLIVVGERQGASYNGLEQDKSFCPPPPAQCAARGGPYIGHGCKNAYGCGKDDKPGRQ